MAPDQDDQLLEDAGEIYADWRVAGHEPTDRQALERLCAAHPVFATYIKRIARFDAGTRQLAHDEGAAGGGLALGEEPGSADGRVEVSGPGGKDAESRADALMEKVQRRGLSFGKYHLNGLTSDWSKIGRGGAGSVYRAWDEDLSRNVALKLLHGKYVSPDGGVPDAQRRRAQARFVHEAQLTAQLDHPGIVPLHDFGMTSTGRPYFTMKLVKGKTLGEVIALHHGRGGVWSLARVLGVFVKVCEAIAYAHDKGVIHRDLKPSNVMVGKFGEVYVMDWGLLKRVERDESRVGEALTQPAEVKPRRAQEDREVDGLTAQGDALGTATYMSPEQALGDLDVVDRCSDIYGLGAILYHILAGAAPFLTESEKPTVLAIIEAHRSGDGPRAIGEAAPRAPRDLKRIVSKAMAQRPGDRHRAASEIGEEINVFLERRIARAWGTSPWAPLVVILLIALAYGAYRILLAR